MPTSIRTFRLKAYYRQAGRCHYCGFPMWQSDPAKYAQLHKLTLAQSLRFQCTGEHLVARQDGGRDKMSNIVAACWFCNHTRHTRKKPLPHALYKQHVIRRVGDGKWHPHPRFYEDN